MDGSRGYKNTAVEALPEVFPASAGMSRDARVPD